MMALAADTSERLASILDIFRGGEGSYATETESSDEAISTLDEPAAELGAGLADTYASKPDDDGHDHGAHEYDITYQGATRASGGPAPGTVALQNRILQEFGGTNGGIYNNRNIRGGSGLSLHAEGRAGDIMVPVNATGRALGDRIGNWLVENARTLGVQEVIWNRRRWTAAKGWQPYNGASPHVDHVHYSMTREAAGSPNLGSTRANHTVANPTGSGRVAAGTKKPASTVERLSSILDIVRGGNPNKQTFSTEAAVGGAVGQHVQTATGTSNQAAGGQSTASLSSGSAGELQRYAASLFGKYGWSQSELPALIELWNRESNWNPRADNPTSSAYGIHQMIDSTARAYGGRTNDPQAQIRQGLQYIKDRYGSPSAALAFWRSRRPINGRDVGHWY